ncbi:hypothetical protein EDD16DRAFT_1703690 [Pisolithus croceorrhizus]|nr:hypothetical protein EDD16DRAFT_1703690 [Pisolithus croceorrhizus]KAI6129476.1 hypothetical protein EV401DRAFT_2066696 [Pisolithus croceorrhizus]
MEPLGSLVSASSSHLRIARGATDKHTLQDNVNNYGNSGIFAGNGGPTLIVVFLAIGIFTVATAAAFSWRRRHGMWRPADRPTPRRVQTRRGRPAAARRKPILWDICTQTRGRTGDFTSQEDFWRHVMPLAAVKSNLGSPAMAAKPNDVHVPTLDRRPVGDTAVLRAVLSTVKRHYQAPPPSAALPSPPSPSPSEYHLKEAPPHLLLGRAFMQIAVTIAMPSVSTPAPSTLPGNWGKSASADEEPVEFCIGTTEIPLREG